MSPFLTLENFITIDDYKHFPTLPKNAFDLLGNSFAQWLEDYLIHLKVADTPIVKGQCSQKAHLEGPVYIAEGATIEPFAYVKGPAYIGPHTEIRHGAYIRGNVFAGSNVVIGHSTEVKGAVFFNRAKAGHFAYVGDSILGCNVNLGAGTKLANLKLSGKTIRYKDINSQQIIDSGLRKWGAIVGKNSQTGCNAVLSPGSILYPSSSIMPCSHHFGTMQ
jgi:NDP-sugar pyrophosphorylase family protein